MSLLFVPFCLLVCGAGPRPSSPAHPVVTPASAHVATAEEEIEVFPDTPADEVPAAPGNGTPSAEDIEQVRQYQEALADIDAMSKKIERFGMDFYLQCLKTVGHPAFCHCLREARPWSLSFPEYVRIMTASPDDLRSAKKDKDARSMIVGTLAARERCVGTHFASPPARPAKQKRDPKIQEVDPEPTAP